MSLLRGIANGRAAHLGYAPALAEARSRFAAFLRCSSTNTSGGGGGGNRCEHGERERSLQPELRGGVFKAVLAAGGAAEFEALVSVYEGAGGKEQELRVAALGALGASSDPALIRRALEYNLFSGKARGRRATAPRALRVAR